MIIDLWETNLIHLMSDVVSARNIIQHLKKAHPDLEGVLLYNRGPGSGPDVDNTGGRLWSALYKDPDAKPRSSYHRLYGKSFEIHGVKVW